jgi:hypothetical protein
MKSIVRISFLLCIVALLLSSCSNKAPKEAKYIPKDASFVFVFDPKSMEDKLEKGNIHIDSSINKILGHITFDSAGKSALDKIKNAGVDWTDKYFVFITQRSVAGGQSTTVNVLGNLKDSSKLVAFLKDHEATKGQTIHREKNYSYISASDMHSISWNDKVAIATFYYYKESLMPKHDSITHIYYQNNSVNKEEEVKKEVNRFYTQKEEESLASQKPFAEMFKEKADGYLFTSSNAAINSLSTMPIQLPKLEDLLKDNYSASTFNFEDGKIVFKSSSYPNKLMSAIFNKYTGPTVNMSMIENYPSQNINGIVLASFNPEIFGAFLKQLEVESMADLFLQKMNIASADLYKCLKGDIAVVFSDISAGDNSMIPKAKLIFNATVGDKTSFTKLMDKAVENGFLIKESNVYKGGEIMKATGVYLHADDKNIILASDSVTYNQYVAKTSKANISADVASELKGKSTAFYLNIESLFNGFSNSVHGNDTAWFNSAKGLFKDVIATSANFDGTKTIAEFKVRMKDEKQNSLVSIVKVALAINDLEKRNNLIFTDSTHH